jgi:hypothetical protein
MPGQYDLLAIGNPFVIAADFASGDVADCMLARLLDIQVRDDGTLLAKYGLKANDAILADEKQNPM